MILLHVLAYYCVRFSLDEENPEDIELVQKQLDLSCKEARPSSWHQCINWLVRKYNKTYPYANDLHYKPRVLALIRA